MSIRPVPPTYAASRRQAAELLACHDISAMDARTEVLGVLLRTPGRGVAYIELRAEAYPLTGPTVDRALGWLVQHGYAHLRDLPLYGISYQSTGRCLAEASAAA